MPLTPNIVIFLVKDLNLNLYLPRLHPGCGVDPTAGFHRGFLELIHPWNGRNPEATRIDFRTWSLLILGKCSQGK